MASINFSAYRATSKDIREPAVIIAGCFALLSVALSIFLILQHLRSYTNPAEQKWIVGVLLMVPVYACESIISLSIPRTSLACDILRNCYEAFALYAFGSYLIACLGRVWFDLGSSRVGSNSGQVISRFGFARIRSNSGGEHRVLKLLEDESVKVLNKPLLEGEEEKTLSNLKSLRNFFLRPCVLGKELFSIIKFGIVQYMILKTFCAFLAFLLELFGVYGDGEFKWYYGYPYITVMLNFSQMWALYCLVQFYNVTHERLKPIKPLAKFISFKAIMFATWWQGVGIALLCAIGLLPKKGKIQTGLQDFLICIEMAIAAIAHTFVFSAKPYHYVSVSEQGRITTQTEKTWLKLEGGEGKEPAEVEKTETEIKAPGTSITESVQDIVLEGGQQVVEDVKLTINQAIEPVEKGVTKVQKTFHHKSVNSEDEKFESEVKIEEHIEDDSSEGDTHIEIHRGDQKNGG